MRPHSGAHCATVFTIRVIQRATRSSNGWASASGKASSGRRPNTSGAPVRPRVAGEDRARPRTEPQHREEPGQQQVHHAQGAIGRFKLLAEARRWAAGPRPAAPRCSPGALSPTWTPCARRCRTAFPHKRANSRAAIRLSGASDDEAALFRAGSTACRHAGWRPWHRSSKSPRRVAKCAPWPYRQDLRGKGPQIRKKPFGQLQGVFRG
jgi:hypothetical protein